MLAILALVVVACGDTSEDGSGDQEGVTAEAGDEEDGEDDEASGDEASGDGDGPRASGVLKVSHAIPLSSLDPDIGNAGSDHHILWTLYDTLFTFTNEDLVAQPGLVREWEWEDELTLRLDLEEGVEFSDGTPFNAEAVAYNIDRSQNLQESLIQAEMSSIEDVEIVDELTVRVLLIEPNAALLLTLSDRGGMMVSQTAAEEAGLDFERAPVGAGQFVLEDHIVDDRIVLSRNENYWRDGLPHLDGMEFLVLTDGDARANAFATGEIDFMTNITGRDVERFAGEEDVVAVNEPTVYFNKIYINTAMEPLDDVRVRQAMNYGIDRDEIVDAVFGGLGEPAWSGPIPPTHWASNASSGLQYEYDPERACELLAEAGYEPGEAVLDLQTRPDADFTRMGELYQAHLEEACFSVELHIVDRSVSSDRMFNELEWHGTTSAWTGRPDPDVTLRSLLMPDAHFNAGKTSPEGVPEMIAEGSQSPELEDRAEAYGPLLDRIHEEGLMVPLRWAPTGILHRDFVQGFEPSLLGKPQFDGVRLDQ